MRPLLIRTHQARIAGHIGGENGGEAADRGHFWPGGQWSRFSLTRNLNRRSANLIVANGGRMLPQQ